MKIYTTITSEGKKPKTASSNTTQRIQVQDEQRNIVLDINLTVVNDNILINEQRR